jgi:RimJ/RimL family protein N-acetyltransferase
VPFVQLTTGHTYDVREIRPDDKQRLSEGLARLSDQSVYRRFLGPKPSFSSAELRYLTEIDGFDHYALVALPAGRPDLIVAVGRFVRLPDDPLTADVAFVVADPIQGRGLGKQLARLLGDAARERGVHRFVADIQADNVPALKLMRTVSERLVESIDRGVTHVEFEIAA